MLILLFIFGKFEYGLGLATDTKCFFNPYLTYIHIYIQ